MKAEILEGLDAEIAKTEKECAVGDARTHSYRSGVWAGLLKAREIVQKTPDEGLKRG